MDAPVNAKACKSLRRTASILAAGKPAAGFCTIKQKQKIVGGTFNAETKRIEPTIITNHTLANSKSTWRGIYRGLKSIIVNQGNA